MRFLRAAAKLLKLCTGKPQAKVNTLVQGVYPEASRPFIRNKAEKMLQCRSKVLTLWSRRSVWKAAASHARTVSGVFGGLVDSSSGTAGRLLQFKV